MSMTKRNDDRSSINRRGFLGRAAAAGAIALLGRHVPAAAPVAAPAAKPNSVIEGVRIGCITYSYRGGVPAGGGRGINAVEATLKALLQDGLSEVELMDGPICEFAGISCGRG